MKKIEKKLKKVPLRVVKVKKIVKFSAGKRKLTKKIFQRYLRIKNFLPQFSLPLEINELT